MGRTEKHQKNEKNKYYIIIGLLVVVIVFLVGIVVATTYMGKDTDKVSTTKTTTTETKSKETASKETESSTTSTTSSSTSTSTSETTSSSSEAPSISVKDLTTQQRAALIILGAPNGWKFNGLPSAATKDQSLGVIAASDTNNVELRRVFEQLGENTSPDDQMFNVVGKEVNGLGGAFIPTYAFGRDGNKIYYYVRRYEDTGTGSQPKAIIENLGVANIDTIWKSYVDNNDIATVDNIAKNIMLK